MTPFETAVKLLNEGLWPVVITSPNDDSPGVLSPGKQPIAIGKNRKSWALKKHTLETLEFTYDANDGAGVGVRLGPIGGVVDIDVDDPVMGADTLIDMFGGEIQKTRGWTSARGFHYLFMYNERLEKYGKAIIKINGIEIRIGYNINPDMQYQSVVPPSIGSDGKAREWNSYEDIIELPESFYVYLDGHFEKLEKEKTVNPYEPKREDRGKPGEWTAEQRAVAYLRRCEPAISGSHGHDKAFKAACKIGPGFDLDPEVAYRIMMDIYNPTCIPMWSEKELQHKINEAYQQETRRGFLLEVPTRNEASNKKQKVKNQERQDQDKAYDSLSRYESRESFDDPFRLAKSYLSESSFEGFPTLRYWLEEWHRWDGTRYIVMSSSEVKASLLQHIKKEFDEHADSSGIVPSKITTSILGNVMAALTSLSILHKRSVDAQPAWLGIPECENRPENEEMPGPCGIVPATNGLIDLKGIATGNPDGLIKSTPMFFSPNCLDYDLDLGAARPDAWLEFLNSIWGDDHESIEALQEWFGYLLTPDTRLQKLLIIIGPTRSGKGTISRTLEKVVGKNNVSSPTLSGMAGHFSLQPLIDKTVAIFPDARLSGRVDGQVIVERLLSISGEDSQMIDRKHISSWYGKLPTRFVIISNELPRLGDASGAMTARSVVLSLTKSFLHKEDLTLRSRIDMELPAILLWAIQGWGRLNERGRFLQPESGAELLKEMRDLSSPIGLFVEECCEVHYDNSVDCQVLYRAWVDWCKLQGRDHPGDSPGFGRQLRAAVKVSTRQTREAGTKNRPRMYHGIGLRIIF